MKEWNFKVNGSIQDIIKKLDATLGSADGFDFTRDKGENDSITFKVHKRGLYAFYLIFINKIIVNGKLLKADYDNETKVEISFSQYFLWKLVVYTHVFLGLGFLIAIFSGVNSSAFLYILGGILLVVGIVLWIAVQKKFDKDIQEYKTLISEILAS